MPDLELPVSTELRPHAGGRVAAHLVPRALDTFEGVLAPTELVRSAVRGGRAVGPVAFWVGALGTGSTEFHVIRPEDGLHLRRERPPGGVVTGRLGRRRALPR